METIIKLTQIFFQQLSTRELAVIVWSALTLLGITFYQRKTAKGLIGIVKIMFSGSLLNAYCLLTVYNIILVFMFFKIGFWNESLLAITIIWFLVGGIGYFTNVFLNFLQGTIHWKTLLLSNLKWAVIVEFVLWFYTFHILIELLLVPFIVFITLLQGFSQTDEKYKNVGRGTEFILIVFGGIMMLHTLYMLVSNFDTFSTLETGKEFLFPIIMSILQIPFIYMTALFSAYKSLFVHSETFLKNMGIYTYTKRKIIKLCHLDFYKVRRFHRCVGKINAKDKSSIDQLIYNFKNHSSP